MRFCPWLIVGVLCAFGGVARGNIIVQWNSGPGANGHHYLLVQTQTNNFYAAHNAAIATSLMGYTGHLATVTSQAEQDFIFSSFNNGVLHAAWIGLTDNEAFGGSESFNISNPGAPYWVWVTGEPVAYTNWVTSANGAPPEPNNYFGDDDFVEFVFSNADGTPGRWNDLPETYFDPNQRYFIVEYDTPLAAAAVPEPASFLVWSIGIGFLIGGATRRPARRSISAASS